MAKKRRKSASHDSGRQHLGVVYAKALVGATEKNGQTDRVLQELTSLVDDVLDHLPDLEAAFSSPRLAHEEKEKLIEKTFAGRMSPVLVDFLKVLSRHGRLDCLRAIEEAAQKIYNELSGRVQVEVETAVPLSNQLRDRIAGKLSTLLGKQVVITTSVNMDLLGGVVVRVGDTVYDGSLAAGLRRMGEVTVQHATNQIRESIDRFALT